VSDRHQGSARRWFAVKLSATCLAIVLGGSQIVDLAGARYLRWYDDESDRLISHEHERVASQRKFVIFGEPLDQNAAIWYQRAFAKLSSMPTDTRKVLGEAVERGFAGDPRPLRALFDDRCREIHSPRVNDALRCTHCDWGLGYRLEESLSWGHNTEALILGYCQVLNGHVQASQGDWLGAADSYIKALSLGSDLSDGDFTMNILSLGFWKIGLKALGTVVDSKGDDKRFLDDVGQRFSRFEGSLPSVKVGLRFTRLWVATGLANDAHAYVAQRRVGLGRLLPWRAVAAWRLSREVPLVEQLRQAVDAKGSIERTRLAGEIKQQVLRSRSPFVPDEVPVDMWAPLAEEADKVSHTYRALQVAIKLQEWHADHGEYPVEIGVLNLPVDLYGLTYDRTDKGKGYRLVAGRGDAEPLLLEHRSPPQRPTGRDD
jgi:hypothetical protein